MSGVGVATRPMNQRWVVVVRGKRAALQNQKGMGIIISSAYSLEVHRLFSFLGKRVDSLGCKSR